MDDEDAVVEVVEYMLGDKATSIFKYLLDKGGEALDDEIARNVGLKLNEVRRALYALSEQGLVSYRRVRDKDTGWYIYYWTVNRSQIPQIIKHRKKVTLMKLKERLKFEEENDFYICPEDGTRYTFDEALENEFKCYRCGSPLVHFDNEHLIEALKKRIAELEKLLKEEESK